MEEQELLLKIFIEGGIKAIRDLVTKGQVNPNARFPDKMTLLQFAVENRDVELVDLLLSDPNIDPNLVSLHGKSALHTAIEFQDYELVERFLRHPAIDPNQYDSHGQTPLYLAISISSYLGKEITSLLLSHGKIQVNKPTMLGFTPIFMAAKQNDLQLVKDLLAREATSITYNGVNPGVYSTLPEIKQLFPESQRLIYDAQTWILSKMAAMKHDDSISYGNDEGACLGVAFTAMVMILANKKDVDGTSISLYKLNRIMNCIAYTSNEHFKEQIDYVHNKKKVAIRTIKQEVEGYDPAAIEKELMRLQYRIKEEKFGKAPTIQDKIKLLIDAKLDEFLQYYFSDNERDYLEVMPYCDTVELFQCIKFHKELHKPGEIIQFQLPQAILPLIEPDELIAEGGAVNVENISGLFLAKDSSGKDEINIFFSAFREKLTTLDFPVSFNIDNGDHAISVHYIPNEDQWVFIDANVEGRNKIVTTRDDKEIAILVRGAYSYDKSTAEALIIKTHLYCAGKNREKLKSCIDDIRTTNKSFKAIFDPYSEKIYQYQQDGRGFKSWGDAAYLNGDVELTQEMIAQANKDKKTIASNYSLSLAERNNNTEYFREYYRTAVNYYLQPNFRKEIISRLNELQREEGGYGEIKRIKIKFLTEVLASARPGADLKEDKENIMVSMRHCYARWQAAGLRLNEVFNGNDSRTIELINLIIPPSVQKMVSEEFKHISVKLEKDNPSLVKIRQLINTLTAEIKGFSFFSKYLKKIKVEFLTEVLEEEAFLLSAGDSEASVNGVLSNALENIIKKYKAAGTYDLVIKGAGNRTLALIEEILNLSTCSATKSYKSHLIDVKAGVAKADAGEDAKPSRPGLA